LNAFSQGVACFHSGIDWACSDNRYGVAAPLKSESDNNNNNYVFLTKPLLANT
jgi:hypothetical protein